MAESLRVISKKLSLRCCEGSIFQGSICETSRVQLIYHLTWWIGVEHAAWIPCLELSPIWFFKNICNDNINQQNNNNHNNNNDNDSSSNNNNNNNNSNNIVFSLK